MWTPQNGWFVNETPVKQMISGCPNFWKLPYATNFTWVILSQEIKGWKIVDSVHIQTE